MTHPRHVVGEAVFVAALGHHVKEVVGAQKNVESAAVTRVCVEYVPVCIFREDAEPRAFFARKRGIGVVVVDLARGLLLRGERHMKVVIEVASRTKRPN